LPPIMFLKKQESLPEKRGKNFTRQKISSAICPSRNKPLHFPERGKGKKTLFGLVVGRRNLRVKREESLIP